MSEKKNNKISLSSLKEGQIVWSEYYQAYVQFVEIDYELDYIFKYLHNDRYCVISISDVYDPPSLIKELL